MTTPTTATASDREIVIGRTIRAPREAVFAAWTDPAHLPRWWGPHGFTTTTEAIDIRPGGAWRFTMHGPDGTVYPSLIVWQEIVPPERIVYAASTGEADDPGRFETVVTFEPEGEGTRLTMRTRFATAEACAFARGFGAEALGGQTLDRLAGSVEGTSAATGGSMTATERPELTITHTFDAPRDLVWRAFTECEFLSRWLTPGQGTMPFCTMDLRPGGRLHYQMAFGQGAAMWGVWEIREVAPPERLVIVSRFSDAEGGVTRHPMAEQWPLHMRTATTLAEADGKTTVTMRIAPHEATAEELAAFAAGMEGMRAGFAGSFANLDRLLAAGG